MCAILRELIIQSTRYLNGSKSASGINLLRQAYYVY